jgi:hypothetical protein
MGPYRTPPEPPPDREPPPRDREDLVVNVGVAGIGAIGVVSGWATRDFHAGFSLAALLVIVGVLGVMRALTRS